MGKLRFVLFASLIVLSASDAAQAQSKGRTRVEAPADIETAEQLYTKLDYEKANEVAERAVKQRNLSHEQLVRGYRILAVTSAILDKEDAAREAFLQLLVLEPDYTVDPNLGPKVSTPFVEARGQFRSLPSKPGISVVATIRSDGGQLRVTTRDPTRLVKKVTVGYRWSASDDYVVSQVDVGQAVVEVPPAAQGRTRLDYYAVAFDERDNAVFEAGTSQAPKSSFAETRPVASPTASTNEKSKGSFFSSPVFWIIAGAAVAGGGTALFFALRPEDPPTAASLSPRIRCGNDFCR